jgi:hypothetical protein
MLWCTGSNRLSVAFVDDPYAASLNRMFGYSACRKGKLVSKFRTQVVNGSHYRMPSKNQVGLILTAAFFRTPPVGRL